MSVTLHTVGLSRTRGLGVTQVATNTLAPFLQRVLVNDLASVFFNVKQFAEPVQYTHDGFAPVFYNVIFDDPHTSVKLTGDTEFNSMRPQIQIAERALQHTVTKRDRVRVRGKDYFIEDYIGDGVGVFTIYLRLK